MNLQTSTARMAIKWGFLTALVELLATSIRYALHAYASFTFPVLTVLIITVGLVLAMREFRQQNDGLMTYGEGVSLGLMLFAIIGILDTTYQQIYQTYVDPSFIEQTLGQTRDMMERMGGSDAQVEQFEEQMEKAASQRKGETGSAFVGSVMVWILGGGLLSLIVAAFMRRTKDNPFDL